MKSIKNAKRMLLHMVKKLIPICAIALFSVILLAPAGTNSANFKYEDFDWDTFYKKNITYWEKYCKDASDKETCESKVLKSQEKFYKKLYKILAKKEKRGLFIDDIVILTTVFYNLLPSDLTDNGEEYMQNWNSTTGAYTIDEEDLEDPIVDFEYNEDLAEYFSDEKDTLKILISSMEAYQTTCYAVLGDPIKKEAPDGTKIDACEDEDASINSLLYGSSSKKKCTKVISTNELGFAQYLLSRMINEVGVAGFTFFGQKFEDPYHIACKEESSNFAEGTKYIYSDNKTISVDKYFEFLKNSRYFDNKTHLQFLYKDRILKPANVDCMTKKVCDNSLEKAGLYEEYEEEILSVRGEMVSDIISILKNYGYSVNDNSIEGWEDFSTPIRESTGEYFFPIGSDDISIRNGIRFADGDLPVGLKYTSPFGYRPDPINRGETKFHGGVDISGAVLENKTNIIASLDGEVVQIKTGCVKNNFANDCGGYGNYVLIKHSNGNSTLYGHLFSVDSAIFVGAKVYQGQVIGKIGSTGRSTGTHLHFEVRVGATKVDPVDYISLTDPRPSAKFKTHGTTLTLAEFCSKVRSYISRNGSGSTNLQRYFESQLEEIYNYSLKYDVNPEIVVIRAIKEGFSPATSGKQYNYWGLTCYNGVSLDRAREYGSLEEGIKAFAETLKDTVNTTDMMNNNYAVLSRYWYPMKIVDGKTIWRGGCEFLPFIKKYYTNHDRFMEVKAVCDAGTGSEFPTNQEDQDAYHLFQVAEMDKLRSSIFGL